MQAYQIMIEQVQQGQARILLFLRHLIAARDLNERFVLFSILPKAIGLLDLINRNKNIKFLGISFVLQLAEARNILFL